MAKGLMQQLICKASASIRSTEMSLAKKYNIPSSYITYFDADDLRYQMILDEVEYVLMHNDKVGVDFALSKETTNKIIDGYVCIDPWSVVDLQYSKPLNEGQENALFSILSAIKVFNGDINNFSIKTTPNTGMKLYCLKVDEHIIKTVKALQKEGIKGIFSKIFSEICGSVAAPYDRVGKRIEYFCKLSDSYRFDKVTWVSELRRFGLV